MEVHEYNREINVFSKRQNQIRPSQFLKTFSSFLLTQFLNLIFLFDPGYDIFQRDPLSSIVSAQPRLASSVAWKPTLRQGCFYLLVFVPMTCALLQLLTWSQFSLHGRRLQTVKSQRQAFTESHSREIKTI